MASPVYEVIVEDENNVRTIAQSATPEVPPTRSRQRSWSSKSEPKKRAGGVPFDLNRKSEDKQSTPCFYENLLPRRLLNYLNRPASSVPRSRSNESRKLSQKFSKQYIVEGGQSILRKVKKFGSDNIFGRSIVGSKRTHERDEAEVRPAKILTVEEYSCEPPKPAPRKKGPLGRGWIRNNPDIKFVDEDITESSSAYGENDFHINVSEHEMQDNYRWSSMFCTDRLRGSPKRTTEYESGVSEHIYCEIEEVIHPELEVEQIRKELKEVVEIHHEPVVIEDVSATPNNKDIGELSTQDSICPRELSIRDGSVREYEGDESIDEIVIEMLVDHDEATDTIVESEEFLECLESDHLADVPELPEDEILVSTPDNWQETLEVQEIPVRPRREHKRYSTSRDPSESPRFATPKQSSVTPTRITPSPGIPNCISTRSETPKQGSSRAETPIQRYCTPLIPGDVSLRPDTPKQVSSRTASPQERVSRSQTPKEKSLQSETPKQISSRQGTPQDRFSRPQTPLENTLTPGTPKQVSPLPETPQDRFSRPQTPKEKSPRPETPKQESFPSETSQDRISRPQTPKEKPPRSISTQHISSRPETPETEISQRPDTPKQKPPRPPPPRFSSKTDLSDTKSSREVVNDQAVAKIVSEVPKKPPRSLKRKNVEKQELVLQESHEGRDVSLELYSAAPYAKVKKSGSLTRSTLYQPSEAINIDEDSPPPVPIQIEELLKPVVPPRSHRPKSMSFGEQTMKEAKEAIDGSPSSLHKGLKKTSILFQSDDRASNDNDVMEREEAEDSTMSCQSVLKKTSTSFQPNHAKLPSVPGYSDYNANGNVVPSVSVVCCVDNCAAYMCNENGCKSESVFNNGNTGAQFFPRLEVGELRVGNLKAHKLKIDEVETNTVKVDFCENCGKQATSGSYIYPEVNRRTCEYHCPRVPPKPGALLDPGGHRELSVDSDTSARRKEVKQILETLLSNAPRDVRYRDRSYDSSTLNSSRRFKAKSKSLPRDSHLYVGIAAEACKKRKDRRTLWYDDDSGGTYGDIDSSDANRSWKGSLDSNITSNSSSGGSSDDLSPFRKLFQFLGSFGRGERRRSRCSAKFKERKLNTSLYCNSSYSSTTGDLRVDQMGNSFSSENRYSRGANYAEDVLGRQGSQQYASVLTELTQRIVKASFMAKRAAGPAISENDSTSDSFSQENDISDIEDHEGSQMQSPEEKRQKKAFFIARELMSSEEVFVDVLKLLNVDFREFVSKAKGESKTPLIPDADFNKILSYLPQLYDLNQELLADFKNRIENWESQRRISDVIVEKGPFLKLFSSYIKEFAQQCALLEECCSKYPRFGKAVKEFEATERCSKLALKHYMLKPVQRITQYRMLLEEYLEKQDKDSSDYDNTRQALHIMMEVADHANNIMRQGDEFNKLWSLQSRLPNVEIVLPHRFLIKEGELQKLSRRVLQPRYFILFNDRLLCTSYSSATLKVDYDIPLTGMRLITPTSQDYQNELSVISQVKSFSVAARSKEERDEWLNALSEAIDHNTERRSTFHNQMMRACDGTDGVPESLGRQAPVWIPDSRVSMCQLCTTEFTVTFRRHHCRACGKVVCNNCSNNRAPLLYLKCKSVRVCEDCYDVLFKEFEEGSSDGAFESYESLEEIRMRFKRLNPTSPAMQRRHRKFIPQRLREVCANDSCSQMSGYLHQRVKKSWRRSWFVLKDKVMYVYRASEDVVAMGSLPLLGYEVKPKSEQHFQLYEGIEAELVFQLEHPGQQPLIFHAETPELAASWIEKIKAETVLET